MKLDLRKNVLSLEGSDLLDSNGQVQPLSKIVATHLAISSTGDVIKFFDWAVALTQQGIIDVDQSDLKKLYEFIEKHPQLTILVKAQVLKIIDSIKPTT